jgi:hypothetical protein
MSNPIVTAGANATPAQAPQAPADPKAAPTSAAAPEAPAPAIEKKEDPFAPRFAALSRQEKALRDQQAAWKAQQASESKEWNERIEKAKRVEDLRTRAKSDRTAALELMKEMDLSFDELTKLHLNGGKPTPEMIAEQARREVEALRKEQKDRDDREKSEAEKREQKAQEDRVNHAVQSFKAQIGEHLKAKPDDYELTLNYQDPASGMTGADLVYQVIEEHYDQTEKAEGTGRVMSHEEAAKIVEDWLDKDIEEKILSRKKVQAKLGKSAASPAGEGDGSGSTGANPGGAAGNDPSAARAVPSPSRKPVITRTLTNADQTTVATSPTVRPKSRQESLAEAAKLLRWSQGGS